MTSGSVGAPPIPISETELNRRWQAVRAGMKERGLDFLIFQNSAANLPGYVKWFTDMNFTGFSAPTTVIFPREDEMTVVKRGMAPGEVARPPEFRGVKKQINVLSQVWTSLTFAAAFDAEKVVAELSPYRNCKIGWVGLPYFQASFYRYVTENLSATFEDATDWVDYIKAIKSEAEIPLIKETCALEDRLWAYLLSVADVGETDAAVRTKVMAKCVEWGGMPNVDVRLAPPGTPGRYTPGAPPKVINDGDTMTVLLETSSPTCYWGELARIVCFGKIPSRLQEQFEVAKQAQQVTVDLLRPGASPEEIWYANDAFVKSQGYPEGRRLYAHGQGVDIVESPTLEPREPMTVKAGMYFAVHPEIRSPEAVGWVCDNFLVKKDGKAEWLHQTDQKIFLK